MTATDLDFTDHATFSQQWNGSTVVIHCAGDIDMLTAPAFQRQIDAALEKTPRCIVLDLTDVRFLASHGMGVLVAAQQRTVPGLRFAVVADGPVTLRPMALIGVDDVINHFPTLAAALRSCED